MEQLIILPQVFAWLGLMATAMAVLSIGIILYWIKTDGFIDENEEEDDDE